MIPVMPPADHAQQLHVDHSDNPDHPVEEVNRHGSFLGENFGPSRVSSQCKSTPKGIVEKLSDTLIEAGTDEKVKQLLANYLIVGPLSFDATNARFKRDTELMLAVLRDIGIKPE